MRCFDVRPRHRMLNLEKLGLGGAGDLGRGTVTGVGDRLAWAAPEASAWERWGRGRERGTLSVCLSERPPSSYRPPLRARGGTSCHPLWMPSVLLPRGRPRSPGRWGQEGHWAAGFPPRMQAGAAGRACFGAPSCPQGRDSVGQTLSQEFVHSFIWSSR